MGFLRVNIHFLHKSQKKKLIKKGGKYHPTNGRWKYIGKKHNKANWCKKSRYADGNDLAHARCDRWNIWHTYIMGRKIEIGKDQKPTKYTNWLKSFFWMTILLKKTLLVYVISWKLKKNIKRSLKMQTYTYVYKLAR